MYYGQAEAGDVFLGNREGASGFVVIRVLGIRPCGRKVLLWDFDKSEPHDAWFRNDMKVWMHDVILAKRSSPGRHGVTSGA